MTDDEVVNIAMHANARNPQLGIQGVLFIAEDRFLQVIEGRRGALAWLYNRIALDDRHAQVTKLFDMPIRRFAFRGWPMRLISEADLTEPARKAVIAAFALADAQPFSKGAGLPLKGVPVDIATAIVAGVITSRSDNRYCLASAPARCPDCALLGNQCRREFVATRSFGTPATIEIEATPPILEGGSASRRQVLIIDDEVIIRQNLAEELENRGLKPIIVENIDDALAVIASSPTELAVLDIHARGCVGRPVIEMLRRVRPEMRVVVMTRYGSVAVAVAAVLAGAVDFLPKPAAAQDIANALIPPDLAVRTLVQLSPHLVRWEHIHTVFESTDRNVSESARRLGIHRRTLQRILKRGAPE
jgi:two-component system response regulator RegA